MFSTYVFYLFKKLLGPFYRCKTVHSVVTLFVAVKTNPQKLINFFHFRRKISFLKYVWFLKKIHIFLLDAPNKLIFWTLPFLITRNPNPSEFSSFEISLTLSQGAFKPIKTHYENKEKNFSGQKLDRIRIPR